MARPQQDAIEMFMNITGSAEALAVQKLEEYHGDLNQAVNAYYNEGDRTNLHASPPHDMHVNHVNVDDPMVADSETPGFPQFTERSSNSFSPLDSSIPQSLMDGRIFSQVTDNSPWVSHPREVREVQIDFKDGNSQTGPSMPMIEEINGDTTEHQSEIHGTVVIDDDNDELSVLPASQVGTRQNGFDSMIPGASAPRIDSISDLNNDIEEEMIRAAIEASKKEVEGCQDNQSGAAHTADDGIPFQEKWILSGDKGSSSFSSRNLNVEEKVGASNGRQRFHRPRSEVAVISSDEDVEEAEEQPLVRRRSQRISHRTDNSSAQVEPLIDEPPSHAESQNNHPQVNDDSFHSYEWGGISSEEHDEAVMLEAAMFGGISEGHAYNFGYQSQTANRRSDYYPRIPRSPSPTLAAQRLLREQQDGEYLAALQLDREKAELRLAEEAAAKNAALEEERIKKEEEQRKLQEKEEIERQLSAKQASLLHEPAFDDENAVTVLIRMPDGSRCGRRFLKTDKLHLLFDFIDVGRMVAPGTYRLVTPFPRRAFGEGEATMTLIELGLTSKQEALFLELK